jgi:hypothetical protein
MTTVSRPRGSYLVPYMGDLELRDSGASGPPESASPFATASGQKMEPPWGIEPQTYALRVRRSGQLS